MFENVIWATDGSAAADRALPYAKALAGDARTLVVVHSKEYFTGRAAAYTVKADEDELEAKIRRQLDELRDQGFDATLKLYPTHTGNAAHLIADVAREIGADAIVLGTRGHGPIEGVLLGSVTQRLLHIAPCPVLAVPPTAATVDRAESASEELAVR